MLKHLKIIIVVIFIFNFGVGNARAQNPPEILFNLYVESVLHPEFFDEFISNNQNLFDQDFHTHLVRVKNKLFQLAQVEIEIVKGYIDPELRNKAMQENIFVGLYFWCTGLYSVIYENEQWPNTWTGSTIIFAKRIIIQLGEDYESIIRMGISLVESQIRSIFRCN